MAQTAAEVGWRRRPILCTPVHRSDWSFYLQHCRTDAITNSDGLAECVRCGATYAGLGLELEAVS